MRISFLTPDGDVYVDAPVKFIVTKEDIGGNSRNHDSVIIVLPVNLKEIKKSTDKRPVKYPLTAKLLPGIHVRSNGPRTEPAKYAVMMLTMVINEKVLIE